MLVVMRGKLAAVLGSLALTLLASAPAGASFHQMKIREVSIGSTGGGFNDAFVELQMFQGGQQFVSGKELRYYDASGDLTATFTFPGNAASGQSQRTILVGDSAVPGGVDFSDSAMAGRLGSNNAMCFVDPAPTVDDLVDCVAWGAFDDSAQASPLPVGAPAASMASGQALNRSIARGCPTLLEAVDDTGSSAADFSLSVPSPRRNSVIPTETACTVPSFAISGPSRTADRTPRFRFEPSEPVTDVECKLDSAGYAPCSSPFTTKRLKPGRHTIRVRGTSTDDATTGTSSKAFTVKRRRR
jgi:hypothetical protein